MIWFVLLGIAAAAIALMIIPLWRRTYGDQPRAAFDAKIYRDQLTELELDAERSRITPDQAASARTEIARRLLATTSDGKRPDGKHSEETTERLTADGAKAIEKVTSAWYERIELRVAAEEKMKVAIQDEKIKQEKLRKRKVDTEAQATREVQTDVLKAAAKRQKTNDAGETATATATETATEMQEED